MSETNYFPVFYRDFPLICLTGGGALRSRQYFEHLGRFCLPSRRFSHNHGLYHQDRQKGKVVDSIIRAAVVALAMLAGTTGVFAAEKPHQDLADIEPLHLVRGVNHIQNFDGQRHRAEVIYAWRENMNAHGYGVYSVLMLRPKSTADWTLLTSEGDGRQNAEDALRDEPFDDEQSVASVLFVKARWKGKAETLAISARRDLSNATSFIDPALVDFVIYRLVANKEQEVGRPFYYFEQVDRFRSAESYCSSDWALTKVLNVPLPNDYKGPRAVGGCIP